MLGLAGAPHEERDLVVPEQAPHVEVRRADHRDLVGETGIDSLRSGLLRYQEFFTVDGLTLPTRMTLYPVRNEVPGDATYEAVCREITFRESFDQSSLERPEGAILLSENDVQ